MMKKLFISLVLIFAIMAGTVFASITLTDYKKIYQEFVLGMKVDPSSIKESDFTINKFPVPYLVIDKIEQAGKVTVKDVEIRFSLMSLLKFSPKIASLKIGEARVYLDHDDVNFFSHDEFISELLARDALSAQASIDKLIFVESDADVPLVIENFTFISGDNNTSFAGTMDAVGDLNGSFVTSGDNVTFKLNVNDQSYNLNVEENYKNNSLESGKFSMETSNLAQKIVKLIPDFAELASAIKSEEKVKITLDIAPSNNYISLKNIVISSDSIAGTGEMSLSKNNFDKNDIKLEFTKIDIDSWSKAKSDDSNAHSNKYTSNKRFDFSKNPMQLDIFFKDIKLNENNSLSDVGITAEIKDSKLYIQDFSGGIDQSGKFKLNGIITQNSFRSLFNGKVVFNHKDLNDLAEYFSGPEVRTASAIPFALSSDIKMSSVDLSLQNLLIKTSDTDIAGNLSTKFIGNSPRTNATIRFSTIDIDKGSFPALSQAFNYGMSLFDGMKEENYLGKFILIRRISSMANYDITFDRLLVGKKMYENANFNLETSPGRVSLEQLFIQNGDDWIDASVALEAQGIRPVIYFTIHNAFMGVDFLTAPSMLRLRKKILDTLDLSKVDIAMSFAIKKLYQDDFFLNRVLFQARNNKNLLDIKKFDADLLGGRMQSSGSILLDPYTLNFVYALNSVHIDEIAKLLPQGMLESGGVLSASGMWSARGDELKEQLYNLYTRSNVVTKDIVLQNFSIDDLIQETGAVNYNISSLKEDIKKAMLTQKTQISDLKTNVELSKGMFTLSALAFKTKYSAASGSALFNLYDFNLDASTIFSFYLAKPKYGRSTTDYAPVKMTVTANGNLLSPKKTADTKELEEILKSRNQQ
jgi:hypothetical protein